MTRIANETTSPKEHGEIEITPEMIEAGMREYACRWGGLGGEHAPEEDVELEMIRAVYTAMFRLRPRSSRVARGTCVRARRSHQKA